MKMGIWVLAIALAFVAGTLVTGTMTWAQGNGPPHEFNPNQDTDGDGVPDHLDSDDDNDGLTDVYETEESETSPTLPDSDGDGESDSSELVGDGLDPEGNPINPTDPNNDDSDGDGFTDAFERKQGSNPNDPRDTPLGPRHP